MNKHVLVGLGAIATAHYVVSPYVPGNGDAADAPPLASISISVVASTGSVTFDGCMIDAITDAEYGAPAVDTRNPAAPALPPTVTAFSVGAMHAGVVTFKST